MFVTAFMAILDPVTGVFTYANAGHNLPIWLKASLKESQRLEMDGIALAVMSEAIYINKKITLEKDDYLLLYTDGVTEASTANDELFTEPRLFELIKNTNMSSSSELLTTIENAIQEFRAGEPPSDDLTMICIHRKN
jgi:sigma-B regulation protein RsbU (phosphoserine phosphatase)